MIYIKIRKILGLIIYYSFAKYLPVSYFPLKFGQKRIRAFCAKLMLEKCGKNVNIERNAIFSTRVELGDNSGIGINASIGGKVYIGQDVMMGPHCTIYTWNHKTDDLSRTMRGQGFTKEEPVYIGDDVWIGGHVIILPGVHIGSHSIIGAGAIVTKDIPEYSVAVGVPAIVKKKRV